MHRSHGHCMTMGTASTMASMVEALGVGLPGTPTLPEGVTAEVVSQDDNGMVIRATAAPEAAVGRGDVRVGDVSLDKGDWSSGRSSATAGAATSCPPRPTATTAWSSPGP